MTNFLRSILFPLGFLPVAAVLVLGVVVVTATNRHYFSMKSKLADIPKYSQSGTCEELTFHPWNPFSTGDAHWKCIYAPSIDIFGVDKRYAEYFTQEGWESSRFMPSQNEYMRDGQKGFWLSKGNYELVLWENESVVKVSLSRH